MKIIVSFCNVRLSGLVALALFDPSSGECRVLELADELAGLKGITGLALSERRLYAAAQVPDPQPDRQSFTRSELLVFDRAGLELLARYPFTVATDVHSMVWRDGALLVVSSGTDELVQLTLEGDRVAAERVLWRLEPDGPRQDTLHLNALLSSPAHLLVAGFGKKTSDARDSARDGFVIDVACGEVLASGLDQPHTLVELDGKLIVCESRRGAVRTALASCVEGLPGYARGMCRLDDQLFVATSVGRLQSRATGAVVDNPAGAGAPAGRCTINQLSADWRLLRTIDLTAYASEIYDLVAIDDATDWPMLPELVWRDLSIMRLSLGLDERNGQLRRVRTELAQRDQVIRELRETLQTIRATLGKVRPPL
ncbi:MAG TPA: DUF4915 domain-containing protein [Thermoanaerobaculia bacterium]|nr:DUF4915 domain-containing protein [Thermoanaerobaculia bacterium]